MMTQSWQQKLEDEPTLFATDAQQLLRQMRQIADPITITISAPNIFC